MNGWEIKGEDWALLIGLSLDCLAILKIFPKGQSISKCPFGVIVWTKIHKPHVPNPSFAVLWQRPANRTIQNESTIWKGRRASFSVHADDRSLSNFKLTSKNFDYLYSLTCRQGKYTIITKRDRRGVTNSNTKEKFDKFLP